MSYICKVHGSISKDDFARHKMRNGFKDVCLICHRERAKIYYKKNKEKIREKQIERQKNGLYRKYCKNYYDRLKTKSPEKYMELRQKVRKHQKKCVEFLSDSYVKKLLTSNSILSVSDITDEMADIKRVSIKIKREIKLINKRKHEANE